MKKFTLAIGLCSLFALSAAEISFRDDGTSLDSDQAFQGPSQFFDKSRLSFINAMNGWEITQDQFEKPIVAIIVNHESINEIETNIELYQNISSLLFESGVNHFHEYNFAIINALEVKEISSNFQLQEYHADRKFFFAILSNKNVGYLYDGAIVKEGKTLTIEQESSKAIKQFIEDFRENKLQPYLKTETRDPTPVIKDSILRVYGSNFISLVKERKFTKPGTMKGLILLFTKQNSAQFNATEAYLDRLSKEFGEDDFQFAIMDINRNSPTYDIKQFFDMPNQPMLQFLAVLPDGATIKRFYKKSDTHEDLQTFMNDIKFLVIHERKQAGLYKEPVIEKQQGDL